MSCGIVYRITRYNNRKYELPQIQNTIITLNTCFLNTFLQRLHQSGLGELSQTSFHCIVAVAFRSYNKTARTSQRLCFTVGTPGDSGHRKIFSCCLQLAVQVGHRNYSEDPTVANVFSNSKNVTIVSLYHLHFYLTI